MSISSSSRTSSDASASSSSIVRTPCAPSYAFDVRQTEDDLLSLSHRPCAKGLSSDPQKTISTVTVNDTLQTITPVSPRDVFLVPAIPKYRPSAPAEGPKGARPLRDSRAINTEPVAARREDRVSGQQSKDKRRSGLGGDLMTMLGSSPVIKPTAQGVVVGAEPPGSARLKRLSLLSKPITIPSSSVEAANPAPPQVSHPEREVENVFPSSAQPFDLPGTPKSAPLIRERSNGMRSSISYSPATATTRSANLGVAAETHRGSMESARRLAFDAHTSVSTPRRVAEHRSFETRDDGSVSAAGEAGVALMLDGAADQSKTHQSKKKGVTITEKHADLLTLIAQKERRVNELKLELSQQEASLAQLKQKWTTIITRSTGPPFTSQTPSSTSSSSRNRAHARSSTQPSHGNLPGLTSSTSTSSTASSSTSASSALSTLVEDPTSPFADLLTMDDGSSLGMPNFNAQAVLSGIISSAYGPDGMVTPSAVEGGKRFWGQLVKTVSAAAVGKSGPDIASPPIREGRQRKDVSPSDRFVAEAEEARALEGDSDLAASVDGRSSSDSGSIASWPPMSAQPVPTRKMSKPTAAAPEPANASRLPRNTQVRGRDRFSQHAPSAPARSREMENSTSAAPAELLDMDPDDIMSASPLVSLHASSELRGEATTTPDGNQVEDEDGWGW